MRCAGSNSAEVNTIECDIKGDRKINSLLVLDLQKILTNTLTAVINNTQSEHNVEVDNNPLESMESQLQNISTVVSDLSNVNNNIITTIDTTISKYSCIKDIFEISEDGKDGSNVIESINKIEKSVQEIDVSTKTIAETMDQQGKQLNILIESGDGNDEQEDENASRIPEDSESGPTYSKVAGNNEQARQMHNYIGNERRKTTNSSNQQNNDRENTRQTGKDNSKANYKKLEEQKTIVIENIKSREFIKHTSYIKSEFNKHFNMMDINACFATRTGVVMIELTTEDDANNVENNWKPHFFTVGEINETNQGTKVKRLANRHTKGIVKNVPKGIADEEMTKQLQETYPNAWAKRFVNRKDGLEMHTVMITFDSAEQLKSAQNQKIAINYSLFMVEEYAPKKRVMQCFKCKGFDHPAAWCSKKYTCAYCAQHHQENNCLIKETNDVNAYKCVNCGEKHMAGSHNCSKYQDKLRYVNNIEQHGF